MLRLLAVLIGVSATTAAHAFTLNPITLDMTAGGAAARATITVTNPSPDPIAVEPTFSRVDLSETGHVTRTDGGAENFLLLPLQAVIPPGASQTFRLQWVGAPDIPKSESFFITFNQLPVQGLARNQGIALLASLSVAVNVNTLFAKPAIELVSTTVVPSGNTLRPALTVRNPTAAHALLKHATIMLEANGITHEVTGGLIEQTFGNGLLQPWKTRTFVLPIDLPTGTRAAAANITYRPPGH